MKTIITLTALMALNVSIGYSESWIAWLRQIHNYEWETDGNRYLSEQTCYGTTIRAFRKVIEEKIKSEQLPKNAKLDVDYFPPNIINIYDEADKYPHIMLTSYNSALGLTVLVKCLPDKLDMNFIQLKRQGR
jgi:hypothetical protein